MPNVAVKKANVMISYDYIIKNPDIFILRMIAKNFREKFKDYLNMPILTTLEKDAMYPIVVNRTEQNLLKWASIKEFDYDSNYDYLYNKFKNMYFASDMLQMAYAVKSFNVSYCIDKIYLYNEVYDKRQHFDIQNMYGFNKVQYVVGDFKKVIDKIGDVNIVYDHDAKRVSDVINTGEYDGIMFGVAAYGYNFEPGKPYHLKYDLLEHDNVSSFPVFEITKKSLYKG